MRFSKREVEKSNLSLFVFSGKVGRKTFASKGTGTSCAIGPLKKKGHRKEKGEYETVCVSLETGWYRMFLGLYVTPSVNDN